MRSTQKPGVVRERIIARILVQLRRPLDPDGWHAAAFDGVLADAIRE